MTPAKIPPRHSDSTIIVALVLTFGLAVLMLLLDHDPAVIAMVITGTGFAAAELTRQLGQKGPPPKRRRNGRSQRR